MRTLKKGRLAKRLIFALFPALFLASPEAVFAEIEETELSALQYRSIGPFRGGRSTAVAGHASDPYTFYMGATGGGVWVTKNAGLTWENISDGQFNMGSIGAVAVAPSDANVIYVGTGSAGIRGVSVSTGDGVYKSTDKGKTWVNVGLSASRTISAIVIHPDNPDRVYVAVQGSAWGATEERGIYRSTDGGATWERILYVNDTTGASDIVMDPSNPRILYAGMWDHLRTPWEIRSGGEGSGIHKSTDGGDTWSEINEGLPDLKGKTGVAVSPANPERVWVLVEAEDKKGGLYRSDDAGASWTLINDERRLYQRSWYYIHVFADPQDENTVYVLDAGAYKSIDGGNTFEGFAQAVHGDHHGLWINPEDTNIIVNANDGGGTVTLDGGRSWSGQHNQPTAQFYRVNADNGYPYKIYGGQQDNSTVAVYSRALDGALDRNDYEAVGGCESGHIAFDPDNPRYIYAGCYLGIISEIDQENGFVRDVSTDPTLGAGVPPRERDTRFNWNAPILVSQHDPSVIYFAGNVLFRSTDRAGTWAIISPDLTRNDEDKQGPMGRPITNEVSENYNTIFAVAESPHDAGVIWTGSDDGLVHITRDGGENWTNVTPRGVGERIVNSIEVSPHDPGTAYVVVTGYKNNDHTPLIYKTTNYGGRWTQIASDFGAFVRVVREDTERAGLLFAGTENGVHMSFDSGASWQAFQQNLPRAPVTDMKVNGNDLVLSTQGRSFWVMDDISPLRQVTEDNDVNVTLYAPSDASFFNELENTLDNNAADPSGQNREDGAFIYFSVADPETAGRLTMEFINADGKAVRTYKSEMEDTKNETEDEAEDEDVETFEVTEGLNRFTWDFTPDPLKPLEGYFNYLPFFGSPQVSPGIYTVRLTSDEGVQEQAFRVNQDPRAPFTEEERASQYAITDDMYEMISELHESIAELELVKGQVQGKLDIASKTAFPDALKESGEALVEGIDEWIATLLAKERSNFQDALNWPEQYLDFLHATYGIIVSNFPPVPNTQVAKYEELKAAYPEVIAGRDRILNEDLEAFNNLYSELNLPAILLSGGQVKPDAETNNTTESED